VSRESVIFLLGFCIIVMPHVGVPSDWKLYFYIVAGLLCMWCGYSLRRSAYLRSIEERNGERFADSFAEHHGVRSGSDTAQPVNL
jgi:hypothetical protein